MRRLMPAISLLLTALALTLAVPPTALAFECTNAGAGSTAPDDHGVSSNTACGDGADASDSGDTAVGDEATASGISSTAVGDEATASGGSGTALGRFATASGGASTALGRSATASGHSNTTLGFDADAESPHTNATAVGTRAQVQQSNALVLGSIPGVNLASDYVDVGIGTSTPVAPLHIHRDDASTQLLVEETNSTSAPRSLFELINNGPIGFNMENTASGDRWRFAAQTTGFRISLAGTGGPEFEVLDNGNAELKGTLTEGSSRAFKEAIESVSGEQVLAELVDLPIAEWQYKDDAARHVGPMAEDFHAAYGLGADAQHIAPKDLAGVALAAIQALEAENAAQQQRIAELEAQNQQLQARLEELDQLKVQVAAMQAQRAQRVAMQ